jgi:hypothetical protein
MAPDRKSAAMPKRTASRQGRFVEIDFTAITAEFLFLTHVEWVQKPVPPPERGTPG